MISARRKGPVITPVGKAIAIIGARAHVEVITQQTIRMPGINGGSFDPPME